MQILEHGRPEEQYLRRSIEKENKVFCSGEWENIHIYI